MRTHPRRSPSGSTLRASCSSFQPRYDGSDRYHVVAGPSIDIRYRDRFFLSTGEGIGMNVLTGPNWRVGFAAAYDLGRRAADDLGH